MNYKTLPAYQSLSAFTEEQWKLSPCALLDAFGENLKELHICRLEELLKTLQQVYDPSPAQVQALLDFLRVVLLSDNTAESRAEAVGHLSAILGSDDPEAIKDREYKSLCVKYLMPAIYDMNVWKSISKRIYFMQPRNGLNETFRYLFRRLEAEAKYRPILFSLLRGSVPRAEYYANACFFARSIATARTVFVHESNDLIGHIHIRPETKIIQLWHGCGVFKHIGLSTAGKEGFKSLEKYAEFPEYNKYSLVTIASPELSWVFEEFMGIPKDSGIIQPFGVCRTDECYDDNYTENCYQKLYEIIPAARDKKVILYAPTYRGLGKSRVSPDALDIEQFAKALGDDYILIMKHHQTATDLPEIPESCRDSFAYDMTRGKGMNINELMAVSDICITDYSSVAFEFSVYERPLLFFVFDIDEYIDNRGLYYNFEEITPGPLCRTNEEMIDYILHIEERFDRSVVTDFKNRFMCSCNGHACERTLAYLDSNFVYFVGSGATHILNDRLGSNGAKKEAWQKICRNGSVLQSSTGDLMIRFTTEHPIPGKFCFMPNPFARTGHRFTGWHMYQYEGSAIYWMCADGRWRTEQELTKSGSEKRLYHDEEHISGLRMYNPNAVFFEAQWEYAPPQPTDYPVVVVVPMLTDKIRRLAKKVYRRLKRKFS